MRQIFPFVAMILFSCSDKPSSQVTVEPITEPSEGTRKIHEIPVDSLLLIADSVVIASHESTNYPIRDTITGKLEAPKLIIDGKPNWKIIHEKKELTKNARLELRNVLIDKTMKDDHIATTCFQPRHAVFIYKDGQLSYIDFCFECVGFALSSDLSYANLSFDSEKWERLREFFINQGFQYEL